MKIGNLSYKMGFLVTKWESWLQNKIFAYQKGFLAFKWESRFAIHRYLILTNKNDNDIIHFDNNPCHFDNNFRHTEVCV